MEVVLDWAKGRGLRSGDNPAAWRGNLDTQLAKPTKVARVEHHPALPVAHVGAFMKRLGTIDGMGARALEFAILTAARSGEVRGATWAEIDLEQRIWTVPASRMKMSKEHRVPLSAAAVALLKALPRFQGTDLVFLSSRRTALSDATLKAAILRMNEADDDKWIDPRVGRAAVPHGFRSTFRDWIGERTNYPGDMAELALAHKISSAVEAAYRRGDMFEKRRRMMNDWAAFIATETSTDNKIVPLKKRNASA